jgi:hypothetical protein
MHVAFRKDASGIAERLALHGGIDMELDMTLRIEDGSHGPKIVVEGIDTSSVKVDERTIRMFKGTVLKKVRDSIKEANDWYRTHEEALIDNLPIPPGVLGIPIRVKEIRAESTGYMVLYLEYGDANALN